MEGEGGREDFLDEDILNIKLEAWKMYFDGAVNWYGNGTGVFFIILDRSHIPMAAEMNFKATNNMAKYETCITRMEALQELGEKEAKVYGDSTFVIAQAQKLWTVKEEHLKPYQ